jgi:hypothetical protein
MQAELPENKNQISFTHSEYISDCLNYKAMKNPTIRINLTLLNDSIINTAAQEGDISSSIIRKPRIMMTKHTYIPVKNCNIVQIEAEVAIMSLNPSITITL